MPRWTAQRFSQERANIAVEGDVAEPDGSRWDGRSNGQCHQKTSAPSFCRRLRRRGEIEFLRQRGRTTLDQFQRHVGQPVGEVAQVIQARDSTGLEVSPQSTMTLSAGSASCVMVPAAASISMMRPPVSWRLRPAPCRCGRPHCWHCRRRYPGWSRWHSGSARILRRSRSAPGDEAFHVRTGHTDHELPGQTGKRAQDLISVALLGSLTCNTTGFLTPVQADPAALYSRSSVSFQSSRINGLTIKKRGEHNGTLEDLCP